MRLCRRSSCTRMPRDLSCCRARHSYVHRSRTTTPPAYLVCQDTHTHAFCATQPVLGFVSETAQDRSSFITSEPAPMPSQSASAQMGRKKIDIKYIDVRHTHACRCCASPLLRLAALRPLCTLQSSSLGQENKLTAPPLPRQTPTTTTTRVTRMRNGARCVFPPKAPPAAARAPPVSFARNACIHTAY